MRKWACVSSNGVELIGKWDKDGVFHEGENFAKHVKPHLAKNYKTVLEKCRLAH